MPHSTYDFTIEKCPLCGLKEVHRLEYELDVIMAMRSVDQTNEKQMELFVTCPNKNEPYKITVTVANDVKWIREKSG
jgi:uncharacterized protein (DUF885 family)